MAREHKEGWVYIYSEELKQEIALSKRDGRIICEDGTRYSLDELKKLVDNGKTVPLQVHILKKVFSGEIIQ